MRKLYFAAATALLLATTSAQAGNGVSFEIDGQRVRIESPRGCSSLSCITISAPGYKGKLGNIDLKGFGSKDKDDDVSDPPPAKTTTAPRPVHRARSGAGCRRPGCRLLAARPRRPCCSARAGADVCRSARAGHQRRHRRLRRQLPPAPAPVAAAPAP